MRSSRAEIKIEDILKDAGINFQEQYSFPDLLSSNNHSLRFDFAIFDDNNQLQCLIEYQGIQHYKPKDVFGGTSGLKKQQYYDMLKRQYCKKHNIRLILIPYWDQNLINYDYLYKLIYPD